MALDPIHERRLTQPAPLALDECELDVIQLRAPLGQNLTPQRLDRLGHIHALEGGVVADALKERDAEP